jgi:predicted amidophosphoribosyltransferase
MAKIVNCTRCGRFFESDGWHNTCFTCIERDEKDFRRIREYLYVNPGSRVFEISNKLDISVGKIKRYLREGRLEIIEENNLFLKCERCGRPICSGAYCEDCAKQAKHDYKIIYTGNINRKTNTQLKYVSSNK